MEHLLDFNVSQFIAEVRSRPLLYDSTSESYLDKDAKAQAWQDILAVCLSGQDQMDNMKEEEKMNLITHLQKKWKNIRDTFVREHRKGMNRKRRYKHYKDLMFLMSMLKPKPTQLPFKLKKYNDTNKTDSKSRVIDSIYTASHTKTDYHTPNKKRRIEMEGEVFTQPEPVRSTPPRVIPQQTQSQASTNLSTSSKMSGDECDSDRLFLLSLLSDLKRVPDQLKLEVKCDLMSVIKRYTLYTNPQDSLQNCIFTTAVVQEETPAFSFKSSPRHSSDESED